MQARLHLPLTTAVDLAQDGGSLESVGKSEGCWRATNKPLKSAQSVGEGLAEDCKIAGFRVRL